MNVGFGLLCCLYRILALLPGVCLQLIGVCKLISLTCFSLIQNLRTVLYVFNYLCYAQGFLLYILGSPIWRNTVFVR